MGFIINTGPALQQLQHPLCAANHIDASVLRLDAVHPVVSGNKWYKLRMYLEQARNENKKTLITFGGAYSNHIVATAAACQSAGIRSIGIIRGEAPAKPAPTLLDAAAFGMQLYFTSRASYRQKIIPDAVFSNLRTDEYLIVPEGGFGTAGMLGAATILSELDYSAFDHILCAVGTGTTLAGLGFAAMPHQLLTGISVLKGNQNLEHTVQSLLPPQLHNRFTILHDYHGGGYAKGSPALFRFMNDWYLQTGIPSDFVYTGKLFQAFSVLAASGFFKPGSRVLLIHSGGLQGNRSLPAGTLIF